MTQPEFAVLASLAASAVRSHLLGQQYEPIEPSYPYLRAQGCSFVTLERSSVLRGCIGSLEAVRPLYRDVIRNATRAMMDPRLPRLMPEEWEDLDITISVLTPAQPVEFHSMDELRSRLSPGRDGLILDDGDRRATFLPAVWTKLPTPDQFIGSLLAKGGWLMSDISRLRAYRYGAMVHHDRSPRPPLAED